MMRSPHANSRRVVLSPTRYSSFGSLALREPAAECSDETLHVLERGTGEFTLGRELIAFGRVLDRPVISLASCVTAWN